MEMLKNMEMLKYVPILIGGPSGVGKSSITEYIVSTYDLFARPMSFTTRKKRPTENDNEYHFVSKEKYSQLKSQFINDDDVYGNRYASSKDSIDTILNCGKFPIKEIHPNNYEKFKFFYPELITILILPTDYGLLQKSDSDRFSDDFNFYNNVDKTDFDIIIYNDFISPICELSEHLFRTIIAISSFNDIFPRPNEIDKLNTLGYNKIAKEFSESKRLTTRNFHSASESFFNYAFNKYLTKSSYLLEIGPGQNWLLNNFNIPYSKYCSIDISNEMSEFSNTNISIKSIRDTGYPANIFDCVIASLADPYFYPSALCEIFRILKPDGYYILSLPSSKWSNGIRHTHDKTRFIMEDKTFVEVYSFTFTLEMVKIIAKKCGFEITFAEEKNANSLIVGNETISPILIEASRVNDTKLNELILLNTIILRKKI